jgi:hypothetical protein
MGMRDGLDIETLRHSHLCWQMEHRRLPNLAPFNNTIISRADDGQEENQRHRLYGNMFC